MFHRSLSRQSGESGTLTEAGAALYERSRLALEEIASAERCVSHVQAAPRGTLKLNAPVSFGILHLGPALLCGTAVLGACWDPPEAPEDLIRHNCLIYTLTSGNEWHFDGPGGKRKVTVSGKYQSNNSLAIRDMLLAGIGLTRTPTFMVGEALQSGALITVLDDYPTEPSTLYAVYPHNRYLSPKVRAFVDFLAERFAPPAPWDRGPVVGSDPA